MIPRREEIGREFHENLYGKSARTAQCHDHMAYIHWSEHKYEFRITIGKWYLKEIATAIGKKRISPNLVTVTKEFLKDG